MTARVVVEAPELTWRGEWNALTTYPADSVVGRNGSSYVASSSNSGQDPLNGPPWSLLASKGDPGPQGDQGPPGASGSAPQAFVHTQGTSSSVWTINHNLGYNPAGIYVKDSAGTEHEPADVEHIDENTTVLHFSFPFGGIARLS
jgi:hypothetical protein